MRIEDWGQRLTRRAWLGNLLALAAAFRGTSALAQVERGLPRVKWDDRFEMVIDIEINQPEGRRYNRPYVAVWVEDGAGKSVRTLSLWVNTNGRGPRWIRDLRRWFRAEENRRAEDGGDLVATISSATRRSGRYSLVWNGRDDAGRPVDLGSYFVCIEAAREHGTYQLTRGEYTFAGKPFAAEMPGNLEISKATVEYRHRAA